MSTKRYRSRAEAAEYLTERGLRIAKSTLQKLASIGGGPRYRRFGHLAVYDEPDLDEWAEGRLSEPKKSTSGAA